MRLAEQIVDAMLEGRVTDWLSDKWNDIKVVTGIGQDEYGMGKPDKGFKPKYGPIRGGTSVRRPVRAKPRQDEPGEKTWDITP